MTIKGFKAVWLAGNEVRFEYYPHIDKTFMIVRYEGSVPCEVSTECLMRAYGEPIWM